MRSARVAPVAAASVCPVWAQVVEAELLNADCAPSPCECLVEGVATHRPAVGGDEHSLRPGEGLQVLSQGLDHRRWDRDGPISGVGLRS
jgi:hypothetical protein